MGSCGKLLTFGLALLWMIVGSGCGQGMALERIADGLDKPVLAVGMPGDAGRIAIVEKAGVIRIADSEEKSVSEFLDITDRVNLIGSRGLLGMAFDPAFETNGYLYVLYNQIRDRTTYLRISRFTASSTKADPSTELVVLEFDAYDGDHNGGTIAFGPNDGYLYICVGDGGCCHDRFSLAQNLEVFNGKILRIDVSQSSADAPYAVPDDNPFVDKANALPEIWAYGVRNPFRASFDRETGDFYFGDVGQNSAEEINFQAANSTGGENYGWPVFEGLSCNRIVASEEMCEELRDAVTFPILDIPHGSAFCIIGGIVYRGEALPEHRGEYFFADWATNRLWSFRVEDGVVVEWFDRTEMLDPEGDLIDGITAFGEDEAGELYIVTLAGDIYRVVSDAPRLIN